MPYNKVDSAYPISLPIYKYMGDMFRETIVMDNYIADSPTNWAYTFGFIACNLASGSLWLDWIIIILLSIYFSQFYLSFYDKNIVFDETDLIKDCDLILRKMNKDENTTQDQKLPDRKNSDVSNAESVDDSSRKKVSAENKINDIK
jgi:hypothetical protein